MTDVKLTKSVRSCCRTKITLQLYTVYKPSLTWRKLLNIYKLVVKLMKTRTALRHNALKSALCRYRRAASRSDMELGHILWPSDPGIQRPGDPVDPVTLFYNELQMSKYVADKRLQWARGLPVASFYRCSVFARFWEVKFWRSSIKCQYFNDGWTDFHKNIYLYIFILGFFRKPEKLGSHTGSKW